MVWPITFGTATSPWPMNTLDTMFNQTAAMINIPCSCAGTNNYSLLPLTNCPALNAYTELCGYRFVASASSTAPVSIQYNGLGLLPAYHADGVTVANYGDVVINQQYVATFHQSLNSGLGGFYLDAPGTSVTGGGTGLPGGRLTPYTTSPVMRPVQLNNVANPTQINYVPYTSMFVPIFNGSTIQQYQFAASVTDTVGLSLNLGGSGSANFPATGLFDVYVFLNSSGAPTLGAVGWTGAGFGSGSRTTQLASFGGLQVNSANVGLVTGPSTSFAVLQYQATYLGLLYCPLAGTTNWIIGAQNAGGGTCQAYIANYYNAIQVNMYNQDTGGPHTYSAATWRVANGSNFNVVALVMAGERPCIPFFLQGGTKLIAASGNGISYGIGLNSLTAAPTIYQLISGANAVNVVFGIGNMMFPISFTGLWLFSSMELGDGTNLNIFNDTGSNSLGVVAWL